MHHVPTPQDLVDGQPAAPYGPEAIPVGASVRLSVPASTGNVGPGYDSMGLALGEYDELEVVRTEEPLSFDLSGEGTEAVPRTAEHLVVCAMRTAWRAAGILELPGLRLTARNRIPHSRGMGSSASAIVAGVVAANALLPDELKLAADTVFQICSQMEGHPDNVAPSLFGGLVVSWGESDGWHAAPIRVDSRITPVVAIPDYEVPTRVARGLLPEAVPHKDAATNAGRTALLVHAASQEPGLLFPATQDLLHQPYRAGAMPPSAALVSHLRGRGLPALVSGAGPTVLVLAENPERARQARREIQSFVAENPQRFDGHAVGWDVRELTVDSRGVMLR